MGAVLPAPVSTRPIRVAAPFALHNIELTNHCPMRCVMCPRTHQMTRSLGFMDEALFRDVIDQLLTANPAVAAPGRGPWLHHFGESLMHPHFDALIAHCRARGIGARLSLNPLMLTDAVAARLLDAGPELLYLSLDGHDDRSFEAIRGKARAYRPSHRNLLRFLERKVRTGADVRVHVSIIDFALNADSIARMQDYWRDQPGVDAVLIKPFTTWAGDVEAINALAGPTASPAAVQAAAPRPARCRIPWTRLSVTWDGDVVPCCFDYNKTYVLGSVRQQRLIDIWNGEPMQRLRAELMSGVITNGLCRNCTEV